MGEYFHSIESEKEFESTPLTSNCIQLQYIVNSCSRFKLATGYPPTSIRLIHYMQAEQRCLRDPCELSTHGASDW